MSGTLANLGLSPTTHTVSFIRRPGGKARNMKNAYAQIQSIELDLVLLDIGTLSTFVLFSQVYNVVKTLV